MSTDQNGSHEPSKSYRGLYSAIAQTIASHIIEGDQRRKEEQNTNKQVANWTKSVANWTRWMVIISGLTCIVLFLQFRTLVKTDETFQRQTRVSVRPWVGLTDDMTPLVTSNIGFNKEGDAQVTYEIISKNYSIAAAQSVFAHAQLLISEDIMYIFQKALDDACSDGYFGINGGTVLFPGKSHNAIKSGVLYGDPI